MAKIISQTNFPFLWLLFQYAVGGNIDKKRLILQQYRGEQRVLEVGCSVGNVADTFLSVKNLVYQGLDIDPNAIALAQRRFKQHTNFHFTCEKLEQFCQTAQKFDLIYFAGVLHHTSDDEALSLLQNVVSLLDAHTRLVIAEPLSAVADDPALVRLYANTVEQGRYLRSAASLKGLVDAVPALMIQSVSLTSIGATPFSWPLCANFAVIEVHRAG